MIELSLISRLPPPPILPLQNANITIYLSPCLHSRVGEPGNKASIEPWIIEPFKCSHSLVPRLLCGGGGKRAWYTLFVHAPSSLGNLHSSLPKHESLGTRLVFSMRHAIMPMTCVSLLIELVRFPVIWFERGLEPRSRDFATASASPRLAIGSPSSCCRASHNTRTSATRSFPPSNTR